MTTPRWTSLAFAGPNAIMPVPNFEHLERERTRAIVARDLAAIKQAHALEYELVTPGGNVLSRSRYIALIAEAPFYTAWEHGEMQVRSTPFMGVVKYKATLSFSSGNTIECWHTDIYVPQDEVWKAVWSQATRIKAT